MAGPKPPLLFTFHLLSCIATIVAAFPSYPHDIREGMPAKRVHPDSSSSTSASEELGRPPQPELEHANKRARNEFPVASDPELSSHRLGDLRAERTSSPLEVLRDKHLGPEDLLSSSRTLWPWEQHSPLPIEQFDISSEADSGDDSSTTSQKGFYSLFGHKLKDSETEVSSRAGQQGGRPPGLKVSGSRQETGWDNQSASSPESQDRSDSSESAWLEGFAELFELGGPHHVKNQLAGKQKVQMESDTSSTSPHSADFRAFFANDPNSLEGTSSRPGDDMLIGPYTEQHHSPRRHAQNPDAQSSSTFSQMDPHHQAPQVEETLLTLDPPQFELSVRHPVATNNLNDEKFLLYILPFKKESDAFSKRYEQLSGSFRSLLGRKDNVKSEFFKDIAAVHLFFPTNMKLAVVQLIWTLTYQGKTLIEPWQVEIYMLILLRRVLFDHEAFLLNLGKSEQFLQTSQEMIIKWLVMEFFYPNKYLPVTGEITGPVRRYDKNAFGPVQKLIIDYLAAGSHSENAHKNACMLVGIWYKSFDPESWQSHFEDDHQFWTYINQATNSLVEQNTAVSGGRLESHSQTFGSLGDLQLFSLNEFAGFLPVDATDYTLLVNADELALIKDNEQGIVNEVKNIYERCQGVNKDQQIKFPGLLIGLSPIEHWPNHKSEYALRLLDQGENMIESHDVEKLLNDWFNRLKHYHRQFLLFSKVKGRILIPNAHSKLLDWLRNELLHPKEGLPIFGRVPEDYQPRGRTPFTILQVYLIKLFTEASLEAQFQQAFSGILGCWYKSHSREVWHANFKRDRDFWEFMAETLRSVHFASPLDGGVAYIKEDSSP